MSRAVEVPWPRNVMLELTNACDLKCRHCPFHGEGVVKQRPVGHMPESLWRAALAEVGGWDADIVLQPWGMGEPLLAPQLWEVVALAKTHARLTVGFYTNGNQWHPTDIEAALSTGLDWVTFSIDGVRREVFEHYRVGAKLDHVLAALKALVAARNRRHARRPSVRINMVQYPELANHADEFLATFRGLADSVMISRFRMVGDRRFSPVPLSRIPCYQLDTLMAVAWDGRIVQCCEDQQGEAPVGWFPAQTLAEIWHGPRLTQLRAAHRAGRYDASPLCSDCDSWTGVYEHELQSGDTRRRERTAGTVFEFGNNGSTP